MKSFLNRGGRPLTLKRILKAIQVHLFNRGHPMNSFFGVYDNFAEASRAAPPIKPQGYDNAGSELWYQQKFTDLLLDDYAVLFWLQNAFRDSVSLFEIGGHMGEAYYAFSRVLTYPKDLQWTIFDVPTIIAKAIALTKERDITNLTFVSTPAQVDGADIVLAAGSLQYIDSSLPEMIRVFKIKPKHILINMTPVYEGRAFVTLQNTDSVCCPYHVFNRAELIQSLGALGYSLIDSWKIPRAFHIKNNADIRFEHYSGFYFRLS